MYEAYHEAYVCMYVCYHEAYVLGNEVCRENLNGAAKKCAMRGIGGVIECNGSRCKALSLKCYIRFGSWNSHFLAGKIQWNIATQVSKQGEIKKCQKKIMNKKV